MRSVLVFGYESAKLVMKIGYVLKNRMSRTLFACVLINIMPVVFVNIGQMEGVSTPTTWIMAAFIVQVLILIVSVRLRFIFTAIKAEFIIISGLVLIFLTIRSLEPLSYGEINILDIADILVRWFSIVYLFLVCGKMAIDEKTLLQFMKWILGIGILSCVYNLFFNFAEIINISELANSYQANFKSFFANRNQFATFLVITIIASLYLLKNSDYKSKLYKVLFGVAALNLLLTFSRTAIIATCLYLLLVVCWELRGHFFKKYLLLTALVLLAIAVLMSPATQQLTNTLIIREESISDVSGRSDIWQTGLGLVSGANVAFGVGEFNGLERAKQSGFEFTQFHSFYIDSLVLGGVYWLVMMIVILLVTIKRIKVGLAHSKYYPITYYSFVVFIILSAFESVGLFGLGYVDTITTVFFVSVPLLYANYAEGRVA